jgi:hypothetical protein
VRAKPGGGAGRVRTRPALLAVMVTPADSRHYLMIRIIIPTIRTKRKRGEEERDVYIVYNENNQYFIFILAHTLHNIQIDDEHS